ncbi:alpha/beta fold hydrolase [Promicromonospora sp. NPDC057138]|uniref:alpha/beta fold hydrolase n=1 Tax=Promicromonospora sp. NPDC057138 TaxID=3346031 RepID=UPI003634066F
MTTEPTYHTTTSADGTEITYYVQGSGPALVITHGSIATSDQWLPATADLARDFTCYVFDRRGRARSGDHAGYDIQKEVEDIRAVVEAAGPGASLLGHSYGALCTLAYALQHEVEGTLFLFEPPLPVDGPVAGPKLADFRAAIAAGDNARALEIALVEFVRLPAEAIPHVQQTPLWDASLPLTPTWARELEQIDALGPDIDRYSALGGRPTHLIGGTGTTAFLLESVRRLNRIIEGSTITELPDLDHFAHLADPAGFAAAVRQGVPAAATS